LFDVHASRTRASRLLKFPCLQTKRIIKNQQAAEIGGLFALIGMLGNSFVDIPYGGIVYCECEVIRNDDPGQFAAA
jgi:hypothetical protein